MNSRCENENKYLDTAMNDRKNRNGESERERTGSLARQEGRVGNRWRVVGRSITVTEPQHEFGASRENLAKTIHHRGGYTKPKRQKETNTAWNNSSGAGVNQDASVLLCDVTKEDS